MKKIIAIMLTLVLLFSFTACSAPSLPQFTASWGQEEVYEKSTYKISIKNTEAVLDEKAPVLSGEGTYTSIISGGSSDGYKIETTMNFVGEYTLEDGTKIPVDDTVISYVNFNGLIQHFEPTSSYKKYVGKTVVFEEGEYTVEDLDYESTITYGEKDAKVRTAQQGSTGIYDTKVSTLPLEYNVGIPNGNYYDNEQLYYMLRAFIKSESAALSFSLVTGTATETIPMAASVEVSSIKEIDTNINGVSAKTKTHVVLLRKSSNNNTGSPLDLYYGKGDMGTVNNATGGTMAMETDISRLVKISQIVPYSNNSMIFDLVEYQYGEIEEVDPV